MKEGSVRANGVEFAYLEDGSGPLVLLLHGFPDNAHTWAGQIEALAGAGYRAAAPFLRGYPPTEIPANGFFDTATLAEDVAALVQALGDESAFVVGHDWGAMAAYGLCAAHPELVRRAVAMAVPHPAVGPRFIGSYDQAKRSFYLFLFQVPLLPEAAVPLNDYEFIERLWSDWSPGLHAPEHVASVKRTLSQPDALEAAIGYYRALFDASRRDPAAEKTRAAMMGPIDVPVMTMFGLDDGCLDPAFAAYADELFTGPYERVMLPGAGHFLHLDHPEEVGKAILRWFAAG